MTYQKEAKQAIGNLGNMINKYLKEAKRWLLKMKMKISIEKSCYMVFAQKKVSATVGPLMLTPCSIPYYINTITSLNELEIENKI
ncbi:hypothetical protein BpHYR1_020229 [Brachionus plicatilis]|uniref:RNA-directed DNA polymerase from mobile element jockey-like n=1 Tax=Brachionus plicatilis TaxID=10195 RepID=A0A3M7RHV6_BRAPC|nr:hypothetical protein BpHYR1_020229 [Brachionus plicatilis]